MLAGIVLSLIIYTPIPVVTYFIYLKCKNSGSSTYDFFATLSFLVIGVGFYSIILINTDPIAFLYIPYFALILGGIAYGIASFVQRVMLKRSDDMFTSMPVIIKLSKAIFVLVLVHSIFSSLTFTMTGTLREIDWSEENAMRLHEWTKFSEHYEHR